MAADGDRARVADPLIGAHHTYGSVTDQVSAIVLKKGVRRQWLIGFTLSFLGLMVFLLSVGWLFVHGVGIWGINIPVAWGFAIINFVWWIGIGHAGTLISAVLLLLRQKWRTSINRFAEAMTLFAVACAGVFPILHLGRPELFYWLFPYPNTMDVWPQFRSPLVWDVFAISTYGLVSLMFWYVGLIPDLATLRDRAKRRFARISYGILSMGWRGSAVHWYRYEMAYLLLAGLATPLVISVHSIVGLDFAVSKLPGWHSTIFPPYFVAGAIYSGFAMVVTLAVPLRRIYGLHDFITDRHLDNMGKMMLATGLLTAYGYLMEHFIAWYSGSAYERFVVINRALGPYGAHYWTLIAINIVVVQLFWFRGLRRNPITIWILALIVNVGMWLERFVIVVTTLHRDFIPSSWGMYWPTIWDWATFIGTLGLFFTLMFLFIRFLPVISISEMRELVKRREGEDRVRTPEPPDEEPSGSPERLPAEAHPWGLLAEYEDSRDLLEATREVRGAGYRRVDAYTPFPVHGLPEALGRRRGRLARLVLVGGLIGAVGGFFMQYWISAVDYPLNVGGKPDNSWPAFIPITFEMTILAAALTAVLGMLAMNRLPKPHHPLFQVPEFERASRDRFFVLVRAADPSFDREGTRAFLEGLKPLRVLEVPS